MKISAIVCAAGTGSRTGFDKNKLLQPFRNRTVLERTVAAFYREVDEVVVAYAERDFEEVKKILAPYPLCKFAVGGQTRSQSVRNALALVSGEIVLVHDGARPFVGKELIHACIDSVKKYGSGICALPVVDTVAQAKDGKILSAPDRNTLFALQTPQGFFTADLKRAYDLADGQAFTDDSSLYARFIAQPHLCAGSAENKKLTFAEDFLGRESRCGVGIDTHAFGKKQNYIVLAGVKVPSDSGLIAHSDGDVLLHAVMDALLSAAGLRDIGYYFSDKDERWKDADSRQMLKIVLEKLAERGFYPSNLSVAVQAQKPRLSDFVPDMVRTLATDLGIPRDAVGITVGTNEGLGYVGEGKGITCTAYCMIEK